MKHLFLSAALAISGSVSAQSLQGNTVQVPIQCYQSDHVIRQYTEAKTWEPMVILNNDQSQVVLMRDKTDNDVHVWLYLGATMCFVERGTLSGFKVPAERSTDKGTAGINKGLM